MKFSVEKHHLLTAVTTASHAAAAKSAIPALEGLLIEATGDHVKISGYDLKTGIVTTVPADVAGAGSIVVSARLLGEIIRKLPDSEVFVSSEENLMVKITCGASEFNILGTPASDYPDLPSVEAQKSFAIEEKKLKSMIAQTNFAVSDNESRPIHTGALFEVEKGALTIVAVDGFRLALRREAIEGAETSPQSFVVPGSALEEVEKILSDGDRKVSVVVGAKHVMFAMGEAVLVSRLLEGEFLNYKNSIPHGEKYTIEVERKAIVDSVERVSLIMSEKLKSPIRCVFAKNFILLTASTALGRASDECPSKGDGEDLEIGFNNRYLLDALKAAPSDKLRICVSSGVSPCVILPADGSGSFLYMVLPVRLKANDA